MNKIITLLGLVSALFYASCHSEKHHQEESTFLVTSPARMDTSIVKDYVCQIRSVQHIELRALERGYLQEIYVDEGQFVEKGQLMFQIMPLQYQAELQKAEAEAEYASIEYKNAKLLADSNVISNNQLSLVKAKYDMALAEKRLAEVHLGFTQIRAPFSGYMNRFEVRLGSLLDEGELLTTLSDNSEMWVYFNVPEAEYLDYKMSAESGKQIEVDLLMANNKLFNKKGKVTTIEADFNNETGNIAFRATFPNPDQILRHGETGSVHMRVPLENALLIPQKATYEVLDKNYVFVVGKDDVINAREIKIDKELPHLYAVSEGLTDKDKILLEGLRKVKNKDKISYEFISPDSAIASLGLYAE